jgi:hypothetical protein
LEWTLWGLDEGFGSLGEMEELSINEVHLMMAKIENKDY